MRSLTTVKRRKYSALSEVAGSISSFHRVAASIGCPTVERRWRTRLASQELTPVYVCTCVCACVCTCVCTCVYVCELCVHGDRVAKGLK